ncbi:MAG: NnrS family protein [Magnetospirillum sp.]
MNTSVILAYGFRPFFLALPLAACAAVLPLPVLWMGWGALTALPAGLWHGHEQIFGVLCAALAGFLLTAMPSWTGKAPINGRGLAGLVILWILGRLAFWLDPILPPVLVAGLDVVFLPALLLVVSRYGKPWEFFLALALLTAANAAFHLGRLEILSLPVERVLYAGQNLFLVLIAIATGRILPVTLRSALVETGQSPQIRLAPGRRHLATATLVLFALADWLAPFQAVTGWIALAAACAQADRMVELHHGRALLRPQVLPFYLAQAWMVVGLGGLGMAILGLDLDPVALRHALGLGAAALVALAVMSIVSLRHSGRAFPLPGVTWLAYGLVSLATGLRMATALWAPAHMPIWGVAIPSILWAAAFVVWVARFGPWLLHPRKDGQPG